LTYGQEVVMPMEFIIPNLYIAAITKLIDLGAMENNLSELMELEEYCFIVGFHQQVKKENEKSWHARHIKHKKF